MQQTREKFHRFPLTRLLRSLAAGLATVTLLSFGLVQSAAAATSHDYVWANGTTELTAAPGEVIEVDLTISGCDDGTVLNGQGFTLLGWLGAYEQQLAVAAGYPNGTASFGPNWPLVTVAPTPLANTTYRIPFQIPEDQAPGATTFRMTNFQGVACSSSGGVGPTINLTIVDPSAPTVAGPPTELTGTPGDGEVALSWTAPADDGGAPVTGYRMEVSTSADGPFSGASSACDAPGIGSSTGTSCTAAGLDNGTGYYFRALAFNEIGSSEYSSVAGPYVPVPPAPDSPVAPTAVAGDAQATVTVGEPSSGATPDSYEVTADPGGASCTITGSSGECTVTGLTNGVAHTFTVTATNTGGTSSPSPASAPVTPNAAPPTTAPPTTAPPTTAPPTAAPPTPTLPTVPVPSTSELVLTMDLTVGSPIDGGSNTVGLQGSGLVPGSVYSVTMFSTPRLLGTGTVDGSGAISATLAIPPDTEPGAHTITVEALGADGPLAASGWFSVGIDGTIVAVSTSGPVPDPPGVAPSTGTADELAFTGSDRASLVGLAIPLLLVGIGLLVLGRRRPGTA